MINGGSLSGTSTPVLGGTAVTLCQVPPGDGTVIISNTSGGTVYIAAGVTATAANGFAIPTGAPPVMIPTYPGSKGTTLSVIAPGTVSGALSWLVSSAQ